MNGDRWWGGHPWAPVSNDNAAALQKAIVAPTCDNDSVRSASRPGDVRIP